jgi:hypothetical protein
MLVVVVYAGITCSQENFCVLIHYLCVPLHVFSFCSWLIVVIQYPSSRFSSVVVVVFVLPYKIATKVDPEPKNTL